MSTGKLVSIWGRLKPFLNDPKSPFSLEFVMVTFLHPVKGQNESWSLENKKIVRVTHYDYNYKFISWICLSKHVGWNGPFVECIV